jgi:hypothetical protein
MVPAWLWDTDFLGPAGKATGQKLPIAFAWSGSIALPNLSENRKKEKKKKK